MPKNDIDNLRKNAADAYEAYAQAQAKVDAAIAGWKDCLENDRWYGYDDTVNYVHPPAWMRAANRVPTRLAGGKPDAGVEAAR